MGKKSKKNQKLTAEQAPSQLRRKLIMLPVVGVVLGTTAVGINAYESNQREQHDLTVIGGGMPVIVQIHDPGCPTCRRLKNIVDNALDSNDSVLYRLADITSAEGKALQEKYAVPHVTLLYFNADGKHVHTTTGLQSAGEVRDAVGRYLG